jgi:hypothetical protein
VSDSRRSFLDEIKHIVEHPLEWPRHHGWLDLNGERYAEVKKDFCPAAPTRTQLPFPVKPWGVDIHVNESVPPNEIWFVSIVRDPQTGEYKPRVDKIVNIGTNGISESESETGK